MQCYRTHQVLWESLPCWCESRSQCEWKDADVTTSSDHHLAEWNLLTSEKKRFNFLEIKYLRKLLHLNIVYMWNQHLQTFRNRRCCTRQKRFLDVLWCEASFKSVEVASSYFIMHRGGNAVILKNDVSTSLNEGLALPVRNHKVYCKVLCILLIHLAASMSTKLAC